MVPGPSLLSYLEEIEDRGGGRGAAVPPAGAVGQPPEPGLSRLCRPVAAGTVRSATACWCSRRGSAASVARIVTADGDLPAAASGESVTLVLDDEIDVSRGDVLAAARHPATVADASSTTSVLWVSERPLQPGQTYLLKSGAATVSARVDAPEEGIDVETPARTRTSTDWR